MTPGSGVSRQRRGRVRNPANPASGWGCSDRELAAVSWNEGGVRHHLRRPEVVGRGSPDDELSNVKLAWSWSSADRASRVLTDGLGSSNSGAFEAVAGGTPSESGKRRVYNQRKVALCLNYHETWRQGAPCPPGGEGPPLLGPVSELGKQGSKSSELFGDAWIMVSSILRRKSISAEFTGNMALLGVGRSCSTSETSQRSSTSSCSRPGSMMPEAAPRMPMCRGLRARRGRDRSPSARPRCRSSTVSPPSFMAVRVVGHHVLFDRYARSFVRAARRASSASRAEIWEEATAYDVELAPIGTAIMSCAMLLPR